MPKTERVKMILCECAAMEKKKKKHKWDHINISIVSPKLQID